MPASELDKLSINTIRFLAIDAVQQANSGHAGLPMGAAALAYTLWTRHLRFNPLNPHWPDRDRFVLSAGHGSMLLYALLHLTGYDLPLDEIKRFRQWGSLTPGHPESHLTPGVEVTTGPLGQGFANGVGMAIAERALGEQFNVEGHSVIDHFIYGIVSDGDLEEGVSSEAASYAGTQRLGKLIYLYDDNEITIEGPTDDTFRENVGDRFRAYGWQVIGPIDGNDLDAVDEAITAAKADLGHPSLIVCTTIIGFGSPNKAGTAKAHSEPLGEAEVKLTRKALEWPSDTEFYIPGNVLEHFREAVDRGAEREASWQSRMETYRRQYPEHATEFERIVAGTLPENWDLALPVFTPQDGAMATRVAGGKALNGLFKILPELIGGAADLEPSTKTMLQGSGKFGWDKKGRNLQYGVREHAMGSMAVGMAQHGGVIPYTATFMVFADYMRPPIRLAAISQKRIIFIFTHDSIGVGEDGPTHEPVEQLAALGAIPGLWVIRPCDANETSEAWRQAIERKDGPVVLSLTRQNVPTLDRSVMSPAAGLAQGAYVLKESQGTADILLIATGSEVSLVLDSAKTLEQDGIHARVISMPCWELFDAQPQSYRDQVLPPALTARLAVEAGSPMGWKKYVGDRGDVLGLDRYGASAPGSVVMRELGFSVDNVVSRTKAMLGKA